MLIRLFTSCLLLLFLSNDLTCRANSKSPYYSAKSTDANGVESYYLFDDNGEQVLEESWDWIHVNYWGWIFTWKEKQIHVFNDRLEALDIKGIQDFHEPYSSSDRIPIKINDLWGYYDRQGNLAIKHAFNEAGIFKDGVTLVKKDGEALYIDTHGETITGSVSIPEHYFEPTVGAVGMFGFSDWPQSVFESRGKKGLKEEATGKILLPAIFDEFYNISKKAVVVGLNNKYGVIAFDGEVLLPIIFDEVLLLGDY